MHNKVIVFSIIIVQVAYPLEQAKQKAKMYICTYICTFASKLAKICKCTYTHITVRHAQYNIQTH